eukprot:13580296-Alexandrium_andersonii.AAC.1
MSASLVGSEMCIRDRFRCSCLACQASSLPGPPWRAGSRSQRASPPFSGPVSYTHLSCRRYA